MPDLTRAERADVDLPDRIVVGANGAYWRDYGDYYSMCPVSEDNDPVEVVAVYERVDRRRLLAALAEAEEIIANSERFRRVAGDVAMASRRNKLHGPEWFDALEMVTGWFFAALDEPERAEPADDGGQQP